ncbi:MAG: hypothetical protein ABSH38_17930 [Verrucomicrobiota bacterium]|jgi:hypothetical protein
MEEVTNNPAEKAESPKAITVTLPLVVAVEQTTREISGEIPPPKPTELSGVVKPHAKALQA